MRSILAIAALALTLGGCTFSPNISVNGEEVLDSTVRESVPGTAEFVCNASERCYYSVYTHACRNVDNDATTRICTTHRIADFVLAHGESKALTGLPADYRHCVARSAPVAPYCGGAPQG